jgi:hypothetical protein
MIDMMMMRMVMIIMDMMIIEMMMLMMISTIVHDDDENRKDRGYWKYIIIYNTNIHILLLIYNQQHLHNIHYILQQ